MNARNIDLTVPSERCFLPGESIPSRRFTRSVMDSPTFANLRVGRSRLVTAPFTRVEFPPQIETLSSGAIGPVVKNRCFRVDALGGVCRPRDGIA
jgi:hypothetical protein